MNWTTQMYEGKWPVFGRSLETQWNKERAEKIQTVLESPQFQKACETAGIPVTRRQASKFLRKQGKAYRG